MVPLPPRRAQSGGASALKPRLSGCPHDTGRAPPPVCWETDAEDTEEDTIIALLRWVDRSERQASCPANRRGALLEPPFAAPQSRGRSGTRKGGGAAAAPVVTQGTMIIAAPMPMFAAGSRPGGAASRRGRRRRRQRGNALRGRRGGETGPPPLPQERLRTCVKRYGCG
jgi:hypothetical protein